VIQSKPYLVAGSFEIAPQFAQSVNDRFTSHTGLMLSGIYHVKENVAFELTVGAFIWPDTDCFAAGGPADGNRPLCLLGGRDTDLTVEIREKERLAPEHVQLYQYTWLTTADLQWSPAYGKVSIHDFVLGQFNLYLSVGAGIVGVQLENDQIPNDFVAIPGPFATDFLPPMAFTTTLGGGLRFYFTDWLGLRAEIRDYVTPLAVLQRDVPTETFSTFDVTNTLMAQLGVSFIF
jgi:outer membrane beta-barrel protein